MTVTMLVQGPGWQGTTNGLKCALIANNCWNGLSVCLTASLFSMLLVVFMSTAAMKFLTVGSNVLLLIAGSISWKVYWQRVHASVLQENVKQKANHERLGIYRSWVLQLSSLDQVRIDNKLYFICCLVQFFAWCNYRKQNFVSHCSIEVNLCSTLTYSIIPFNWHIQTSVLLLSLWFVLLKALYPQLLFVSQYLSQGQQYRGVWTGHGFCSRHGASGKNYFPWLKT